jgi:hypothetical protein
MTSNNRGDEIDEFKGEKIYKTREGRLRAIAHIIKEYLQVKEIQSDPKTLDDAMAPITNMVLNDKEFRKFALENYKTFIFYDNKDAEFHIKKITDEISAALIKEEENIGSLDNKEFENKITQLESSLNKKDKKNNNNMIMGRKTITINEDTHRELLKLEVYGESVDDIIKRLLDFYERHRK